MKLNYLLFRSLVTATASVIKNKNNGATNENLSGLDKLPFAKTEELKISTKNPILRNMEAK